MKGSALQAPHRELGAGGAREPVAYMVNVPLSRNTRRNGPIEVWPNASHLWNAEVLERHGLTDDVQDGSNPGIEELAARIPSEHLLLEPGDVLIRDPGMLHRGTPNRTRRPRTMLTLCYLRRDHDHDYGTTEHNFDTELFCAPRPERPAPLPGSCCRLTSRGRSAETEPPPPNSPWHS